MKAAAVMTEISATDQTPVTTAPAINTQILSSAPLRTSAMTQVFVIPQTARAQTPINQTTHLVTTEPSAPPGKRVARDSVTEALPTPVTTDSPAVRTAVMKRRTIVITTRPDAVRPARVMPSATHKTPPAWILSVTPPRDSVNQK